jgi:hypothetical protein
MPSSLASYHSADWPMRPTAICAGHIARRRSVCASATRRASSWVATLAPGPAISPASVSTSSDEAGMERAGRLSPWRSAFLAARAPPRVVCVPVQGHLFPPCGNPLSRYCSLRGNLLLRPVEFGSVDPHAAQNDRELARDGDCGLSEPISLGEPRLPSLQRRPFWHAGQQYAGRFEKEAWRRVVNPA